jgi:membrane-bound serine protease (ClpP class)
MDPMLVWGASLIGAAALLLVIEMFVPSGGVIAVTAGVVGLSGVVCLFLMDANPVLWGSLGLLTLLVMFPLSFALWVKILPSTPIGRVLLGMAPESAGEPLDPDQAPSPLAGFVGAEGVAATPLRPVGKIELAGVRYEALAEGLPVETGERVRVIGVSGNELRVRAL